MNRIRVGDIVIVKSGNDKNRQGEVIRIFHKKQSAIVKDVRVLKKAVKADPNRNISSGIISQEFPIPLSKLMLYNPVTKKGDKASIQFAEGKKVRHFRSTQTLIESRVGGVA
jgi:large subunit ribosomal protein L24